MRVERKMSCGCGSTGAGCGVGYCGIIGAVPGYAGAALGRSGYVDNNPIHHYQKHLAYHIKGTIEIFLKDGEVGNHTGQVAGWFSQHFGALARINEKITNNDFLTQIEAICKEQGLNTALMAEADNVTTFYEKENVYTRDDNRHDLTDCISSLRKEINANPDHHEISLSLHLKNEDFNMAIQIVYTKAHRMDRPAITVIITAMPMIFFKRIAENKAEFNRRMNMIGKRLIENDDFAKDFETKQKDKLSNVIDNFSITLKNHFDIIHINSSIATPKGEWGMAMPESVGGKRKDNSPS